MSFDIDDILKEIEEKKATRTEVTAYLDRYFLDGMIKEYYENAPKNISVIFAQNQVNISEYNFTGADFRGLTFREFDLFDFTNCDISSVHLDRIGIEFFKEYIRKGTIRYDNLILDGANLGPKIYYNPRMGIRCKIFLNFSNLNLSSISFRDCNLLDVIFDDANISGCNFIGSRHLNPQNFAYTKNFQNAKFFQNENDDQKFKDKVVKYSQKPRADKKTFYSKTNNFIAKLFDNPDQIRVDDKSFNQ